MRVSVSLAKLNIPSWYKERKSRTSKWKKEKESRTGWRKKEKDRGESVDSISLYSQDKSRHRWSYPCRESLTSSNNSFLCYKEPYLGWRAQERSKLSPSYLSPPNQRLSSSIMNNNDSFDIRYLSRNLSGQSQNSRNFYSTILSSVSQKHSRASRTLEIRDIQLVMASRTF